MTNPSPGGGNSSASWAQVEVHAPVSTISVQKAQPYVFGFWQAMLADFTHSTVLDLVGAYGSYWAYAPGNGEGGFPFGSIVGGYNLNALGGAFGDFNGDGNVDLVLGVQNQNLAKEVKSFLGDGQGNFKLQSTWRDENCDAAGVITAGDFNRDGKLDLAIRGGRLCIYLGNGDGTFTQVSQATTEIGGGMVMGDFNGDGKLDVAVLQAPLTNNNNNGLAVYVLLGNGDGTFKFPRKVYSDPTTLPCGNFKVGDFKGDGTLDLAFCDESGEVVILLGKGDGTFPDFAELSGGGSQIYSYAIGDVNSDGIPDVVAADYQGAIVFLGNGDGTFQPVQLIKTPFTVNGEEGLQVGDFNADGLLDFILQNGGGMDVVTR